jgi:Cu(I)/Ag(I) efflux system membrane protein CusA/SilA
LAVVAPQTCIVMLVDLDHDYATGQAKQQAEGKAIIAAGPDAGIMEGAVECVRPKMMAVTAIMAAVLPIMVSPGMRSEIMHRIAVPMLGGAVSSTKVTLIVIPAVYAFIKCPNSSEIAK